MAKKADLEEIRKLLNDEKFIISDHARVRMFQRNVTTEEINEIIVNGEIIENYPDNFPCPSVLILGLKKGKSLHIVAAQCENHVRIITVYEPDEEKWVEFRKRKE